MASHSFNISWKSGAYYVDIPNYQGGRVYSSEMLETELLEIVGHLGAALMQTIESDDQIIVGHVQDAHNLAVALRRKVSGTAPGASAARVIAIGDHSPEYSRTLDAVAAEMGAK